MSEKFIVVGDIHGCLKQLDEILEQTARYIDHTYVFLGDYIDRGPDSEGVVKRLQELDGIFLMGNHEEMLLNMIKYSLPEYAGFTLKSSSLSRSSIRWIERALVDHYETENYIFVHAGLDRNKSLAENGRTEFLWTRGYGDYRGVTDKKVIHGHTNIKEPEIEGNRININTGCGSDGRLTALVLPEFEFISSSPTFKKEKNWEEVRKVLEEELAEMDRVRRLMEQEEFGELEEV